MRTLARLALDLQSFHTTSRALVEDCLARITAPAGEGSLTFLRVYADTALAAADFHDRMRRLGAPVSPYAGIPMSIKDLFDVAGEVTTAGSVVLRDSPPAERDAIAVARLKAAGFIPIGRTNMTELAFSGLGINPHYRTPLNIWDRETARIPGGSSSGAAVSITDGMAYAALGTDTGGSCRIPAALCGIVGFKPTAHRVPLTGTVPLSTSLDSIGPLANSVSCCAILDALLSGSTGSPALQPANLHGLRLAVPECLVFDDIEPHVAQTFSAALSKLSHAGVQITEIPLRELLELPNINRKGGLSAAEAYAYHRQRLETKSAQYDPRVLSRIVRGREQDAADYIELLHARSSWQRRVSALLQPYDALVMPTTPIVAPKLSDFTSDETYTRLNTLVLRNPSIINFLDGCAISIPCHRDGEAPVGLTLAGLGDTDRNVLSIAAAVEALPLRES